MVNVMLQNIEPVERMKPFLGACKDMLDDPNNAHKIELQLE